MVDTHKPVVIGLDISTSVVGIAVLSCDDSSVVDAFGVDLRKTSGLFEKARVIRSCFEKLVAAHPVVSNVFVEQSLAGFSAGRSSSTTLFTLAKFNGIVSMLACDAFKNDPEYVDFTKARNLLGIKIDKKLSSTTKEQIFQQVSARFRWPWLTKTIKTGPRKGMIITDESQYDVADAWVVATAGSKYGKLSYPITLAEKREKKLKKEQAKSARAARSR